jgi:hypothetical protein
LLVIFVQLRIPRARGRVVGYFEFSAKRACPKGPPAIDPTFRSRLLPRLPAEASGTGDALATNAE